MHSIELLGRRLDEFLGAHVFEMTGWVGYWIRTGETLFSHEVH